MTRLVFRLALFLPAILGMAAVSYIADPGGLFIEQSETYRLVEGLLNGKSLVIDQNMDQRSFKRIWFDQPQYNPNIVLLGSSRSMYVTSHYVQGVSFFNASIPSGSLGDGMDVYTHASRKQHPPSVVLFEASPFTLPGDLRAFLSDHRDTVAKLNLHMPRAEPPGFDLLKPLQSSRYFALVSPVYFQSALFSLFKNRGRLHLKAQLVVREDDVPIPDGGSIMHADGSIFSPGIYRSYTQEMIDRFALEMGRHYVESDMGKIPSESKKFFEDFIQNVQQNGFQVVFFLPPYHPAAYNFMRDSDHKTVPNLELYFRAFAQKNHIEVLGSYDPAALNCSADDFFDGHHPKATALDRIFKEYKPGFPPALPSSSPR